jgi:hypothetical protein
VAVVIVLAAASNELYMKPKSLLAILGDEKFTQEKLYFAKRVWDTEQFTTVAAVGLPNSSFLRYDTAKEIEMMLAAFDEWGVDSKQRLTIPSWTTYDNVRKLARIDADAITIVADQTQHKRIQIFLPGLAEDISKYSLVGPSNRDGVYIEWSKKMDARWEQNMANPLKRAGLTAISSFPPAVIAKKLLAQYKHKRKSA